MKFKLFALLALATAACSASTISIVGFEDGSDFDYNDTVITVSNVSFHTTGVWHVPAILQFPNETPFPGGTGFFFDTATATGPVIDVLDFQQTSVNEHVEIEIGNGAWVSVGSLSSTLNASIGEAVHFRLVDSGGDLFPQASLNGDHQPHAVEVTLTPEPSLDVLILSGLALIIFGKLRKGGSRC